VALWPKPTLMMFPANSVRKMRCRRASSCRSSGKSSSNNCCRRGNGKGNDPRPAARRPRLTARTCPRSRTVKNEPVAPEEAAEPGSGKKGRRRPGNGLRRRAQDLTALSAACREASAYSRPSGNFSDVAGKGERNVTGSVHAS
jgi:hypothetical protein